MSSGKDAAEAAAEKAFIESYGNIINEISQSDVKLVKSEMMRTIKEKGIYAFLKKGFTPYAAAAVILAFSGKEVDRDSVIKLVNALSMEPNEELLKDLESLNYKNHLLYINALYLFLAVGSEPTEDGILRVVEAMGAKPDKDRASDIMRIYNTDKAFDVWK